MLKRKNKGWWSIVFAAAMGVVAPTWAASTGWNQTTTGTYSYADTANWVGGTINDTFDSSLSLTDNGTSGNQTLTFGADYTTAGLLNFAYTDANGASIPYNFTLRADGTADRTLTLGGNFTFSPVRTTRLLTIGSATSGQKLTLNLGGSTRTLNVNTGGNNTADPGSGVTLLNAVSNGSISKTSGGWLKLNGAEANTFSGLTVSAGVVSLGKTAGVDAVGGDITVNGGTLLFAADNQVPNSASITIQSGSVFMAALNSSASGNTTRAETIQNLTISGGVFNSGPKSNGSAAGAAQAVLGTMSVSGGTVTLRNGSTFTANRLEITGSTVTITGSAGSGTPRNTLVIGSGGLEITQIASGAFTPITGSNWGRMTLQGNVVYNGNGTNANTATISAVATSGSDTLRTIDLNAGTRTFTINDGAADVDLLLQTNWTIINGGMTKAGTGTLEIDSTGTYTGATTVSAGRLLINGTVASAATVNGGILGGTGTISGGATVNGGAVNPGVSSFGTLTLSGATFADGSTLAIDIGTAGTSDVLAVAGNLNLSSLLDTLTINGSADGSNYTIATYTGTLSGTFDTTNLPSGYGINYGTGSNSMIMLMAPVPEPTSMGLIGLSVAGLLQRRKYRGRLASWHRQ